MSSKAEMATMYDLTNIFLLKIRYVLNAPIVSQVEIINKRLNFNFLFYFATMKALFSGGCL